MKKTVVVISVLATYGGAGMIAEEFQRRGDWDVKLIVVEKDEPQGLWKKHNATLWGEQNWFQRQSIKKSVRKADLVILAGTPALDIWLRVLSGKGLRRSSRESFKYKFVNKNFANAKYMSPKSKICLLATDSLLLIKNDEMNYLYSLFPELKIFAMPDLIPFIRAKEIIPFYPIVHCPIDNIKTTVSTPPVVGHSPSLPSRYDQKGTKFILDILQKHGIQHDLITGVPYEVALQRKSQLDIFVDQISFEKFEGLSWCGGVGKSGLEAMALGCAVIASGKLAETEPFMPLPPIIFADRANFEEKLLALLESPEEIRRIGDAGKKWFDQYASPSIAIDYLIKHAL